MIYKVETESKKYDTVSEANAIIDTLQQHSEEITTLDLSLNTYMPAVFKKICEAIKKMASLKIIRLESVLDTLTAAEAMDVLQELGNSLPESVISLEMRCNALSCEFPESIGNIILRCPLEVMVFYDCGLGEEGLKRISVMIEKIVDKTKLRVLDLSRNRINRLPKDFGEILSRFPNLCEIRLRANTIYVDSMGIFLDSLKNKSLKVLDLSDNFFDEKSCKRLGEIFLDNDLTELHLQDIKTETEAILEFFELAKSKRTQDLPGGCSTGSSHLHLDLSYNDFDNKIVSHLEALSFKYVFDSLLLYGNDYEEIEALKSNIKESGGCLVEEENGTGSVADIAEMLKDL